ncbi:unknown protein [Seminavis robusta]|uniref:Uncharacterized protein n=1 Tax=Seminavis robusta TaxID=568900 RepID=A0A9N8E8A1_9STRA|nr:unknown protein [Seminavis robusta]|eukprot:Sro793_g203210.1 n/a (372) ;mRNA; f:2255-3457
MASGLDPKAFCIQLHHNSKNPSNNPKQLPKPKRRAPVPLTTVTEKMDAKKKFESVHGDDQMKMSGPGMTDLENGKPKDPNVNFKEGQGHADELAVGILQPPSTTAADCSNSGPTDDFDVLQIVAKRLEQQCRNNDKPMNVTSSVDLEELNRAAMEDTIKTPSMQHQQDNNEVTIPSRWLELARQTPMAGPGAFQQSALPPRLSSRSIGNDDSGLVEARKVVDESATREREEAELVDEEEARRRSSARRAHGDRKIARQLATGCGLLVLVVGIVVLVCSLILVDKENTQNEQGGATVDSDAKSIETISPTQDLLAFLDPPDYTVWAIMEDENSTQAKAYEWLLEDQMLGGNYTQERLRQRFALATSSMLPMV